MQSEVYMVFTINRRNRALWTHPKAVRKGFLTSYCLSLIIAWIVAGRHRESRYPIISLAEAYEQILSNTPVLETEIRAVNPSLIGSILAGDVHSELQIPSTRTTNVDGYAVDSTSILAGFYPVLSNKNYPGSILTDTLPKGHIYRINTGAPLPKGTDAVIMVEDTELVEADQNTKDEKVVKLLVQVPTNENVRMPGTDVKKGDLVLEKGTRISEVGGELGSLIFVGRKTVSCSRYAFACADN